MAKLTKKQIKFLNEYDVPENKTFDATGYSSGEYKKLMRDNDLWIAYGVIPCDAMGHKLRTRSGHCFQCDPDKLRYLIRHYEDQYLYLAYSPSSKFIKVGIAKDLYQREDSLNETRYGDIDDWQIFLQRLFMLLVLLRQKFTVPYQDTRFMLKLIRMEDMLLLENYLSAPKR